MHWISKIPQENKGNKVIVGAGKDSVSSHLGSWSNTELLFRGAKMKDQQLEDWRSSVWLKGLKNILTDKVGGRNAEKPGYINM